ncbi:MAG TPA: Hpt domain-containing protein [Stellaceae bacterium]|nr:Hpt domain-containing protein [Stellaceae bacterium]
MASASQALKVRRGVGAGGAPYEILEVPHELGVKAGDFRADRFDAALIAARIAELANAYPDLVRSDIEQLAPLWRRATAAQPDPKAEEELFRIAHDLCGQSGTLGYGLIASIARGLRMLLEGGAARRPHTHPAAAAHIAALEQAVRHAIKGDGGELGKQILSMLHTAVVECYQAS